MGMLCCWIIGMEIAEEEIGTWLEREVTACQFQDVRHGKRFSHLARAASEQIGGSIPFTCQDWAATAKTLDRMWIASREDPEITLFHVA